MNPIDVCPGHLGVEVEGTSLRDECSRVAHLVTGVPGSHTWSLEFTCACVGATAPLQSSGGRQLHLAFLEGSFIFGVLA